MSDYFLHCSKWFGIGLFVGMLVGVLILGITLHITFKRNGLL